MSIGDFGPQAPNYKRKRDDDDSRHARKRARIDIDGVVHRIHQLASLRDVPLQTHSDLAQLIHEIGRNLDTFSASKQAEVLSDLTKIKSTISGDRADQRNVIREINQITTTLHPSRKRAHQEEDIEEMQVEGEEIATPTAKRARQNALSERYLQGTATLKDVLEDIFSDPTNQQQVVAKAHEIVNAMNAAKSNQSYFSLITNIAISSLFGTQKSGDPETLKIFAEAILSTQKKDLNLFSFLHELNSLAAPAKVRDAVKNSYEEAIEFAKLLFQTKEGVTVDLDVCALLFHMPADQRREAIELITHYTDKIKPYHLDEFKKMILTTPVNERHELAKAAWELNKRGEDIHNLRSLPPNVVIAVASLVEKTSITIVGKTLDNLYKAIARIPQDERADLITDVKSATLANSHSEDLLTLINRFSKIHGDDRKNAIAITKTLFNNTMTGDNIADLVEHVLTIAPGQQRHVVTFVKTLAREHEISSEIIILLKCIASIPRRYRASAVRDAQPLLRDNALANEKVNVIEALAAIPQRDRADVIAHTKSLLLTDYHWNVPAVLLRTIAAIPDNERLDVITHSRPWIKGDKYVSEIKSVIDAIARTPRDQRTALIAPMAAALTPLQHIENWQHLMALIIDRPIDEAQVLMQHTTRLSSGLDNLNINDIALLFLDLSMARRDLSEMSMTHVVESVVSRMQDTTDLQERRELLSEAINEASYDNMSNEEVAYILNLERKDLQESPEVILQNLVLQFKNRILDRLTVEFLNEPGVDAGGLGREFVSELVVAIKDKLHCKEHENGLFRPECRRANDGSLQPLTPQDKQTLYNLGMLLMFCLNAEEDYPIGMVFDGSLFAFLTNVNDLALTNYEHLGFNEKLSLYEAMTFNTEEKKALLFMKECLAPLADTTPETVLTNGYAVVEADESIASLDIDYDVDKIRAHYPTIQQALQRHITQEIIEPVILPLLELAKGMKEAPFTDKVSWTDIQKMQMDHLSESLQGIVTREKILDKLEFAEDIPENKQQWVENWIRDTDDEKLRKFLFFMTGAPSIGRKPLSIEKSSENIIFHTCFNRLDLPIDFFDSEALFVSMLEKAIGGKEYTIR
jgi:hypothetical protein